MSSEFSRIRRLEARFRTESEAVLLAIGDDCAVLAPSVHPRVWTVDSAVAGVHFTPQLMSLEEVGYRAFMAAASDVAAMGGRAIAALSALILPRELDDEQLDQLTRGLARAAAECSCPIVGGNLSRGGELSLTTSVLGECPRGVLTRAGARVGDGLYVSGTLGGAALGLRALQRGADQSRFQAAISRFRAPRARLDLALELATLASAAIDLSDGLQQDLGHLCAASGVGARVELRALPLLPEAEGAARELGCDAYTLAVTGGEDYELLFTAAASLPPTLATRIGTIVEAGAGVSFVDAEGRPVALRGGFDHFAES